MAAKRALNIALIPGDGIGTEVIPAARRILEALSSPTLAFTFTSLPAGFGTFQATGTALPHRTLDVLRTECHGALFGAVSSPTTPTKGYSSPIVALRKQLDLYANIRPVRSVPLGGPPRARAVPLPENVDLVTVRENTEDLYVKEERTFTAPDGSLVAEATKRISERASRRIARIAGDLAVRRAAARRLAAPGGARAPLVTITHKSNVLPATDGLFRRCAQEVLGAPPYDAGVPPVRVDEQIIDSLLYKLFLQPQQYDVIVAPNLYGDLLSDAAAALVGSLGLVPSANLGDDFVVGEPCHGSAPDIAGRDLANPIAAIRSAGLMLECLGLAEEAGRVEAAVEAYLRDGSSLPVDLGGRAGTGEVTEGVLARL